MKYYSVTACSPRKEYHRTVWLKARNIKAARMQYAALHPHDEVLTVRPHKSDQDYWRRVWWQAYQNMPSQTVWWDQPEHRQWMEIEGKVPLPVWIKGTAKGSMRMYDGKKFKMRKPSRTPITLAKAASLASLLGYAGRAMFSFQQKGNNKTFQRGLPAWPVVYGMAFGVKPKGERAKVLLKLAGPNGAEYARKELKLN